MAKAPVTVQLLRVTFSIVGGYGDQIVFREGGIARPLNGHGVDGLPRFVAHVQDRAGRVISAFPQLADDPMTVLDRGVGIRKILTVWIIKRMIWKFDEKMVTRHGPFSRC